MKNIKDAQTEVIKWRKEYGKVETIIQNERDSINQRIWR